MHIAFFQNIEKAYLHQLIKLGQFIASAPGIFPDAYVTEMQALLDRTTPVEFADLEKTLKTELGEDFRTHFRSIEELPLASASIAQVHAAVLKDGQSVVLKIQRPNIEAKMDADLGLMSFAAKLLEILLPDTKRAGVTDVIHELGKSMADETDFIQEAKNIQEFEQFLINSDETDVVVPQVIKKLSTKRVLTMSRLYGSPLTDLNPDTAGKLKVLCTYDTRKLEGTESSPIMADGALVGTTAEDIFSIEGRGTVATGRIERGVCKVGQEVEIVGFTKTAKTTITGIEMSIRIAS